MFRRWCHRHGRRSHETPQDPGEEQQILVTETVTSAGSGLWQLHIPRTVSAAGSGLRQLHIPRTVSQISRSLSTLLQRGPRRTARGCVVALPPLTPGILRREELDDVETGDGEMQLTVSNPVLQGEADGRPSLEIAQMHHGHHRTQLPHAPAADDEGEDEEDRFLLQAMFVPMTEDQYEEDDQNLVLNLSKEMLLNLVPQGRPRQQRATMVPHVAAGDNDAAMPGVVRRSASMPGLSRG